MNTGLLGFLSLSFFLAIAPGPSVIYVAAYSLRYGTTSGIVSALGVSAGSVVSILIAAFGLSTLVSSYPNAMNLIQTIGGCYILFLAMRLWPDTSVAKVDGQNIQKARHSELFKHGFVTSLLNPKDILFYIAFIPAFISKDSSDASYLSSFLLLAFSYAAIGLVTKCAFAIFSGSAKTALESKQMNWVNYIASIILGCLGIFLVGQSLLVWFI